MENKLSCDEELAFEFVGHMRNTLKMVDKTQKEESKICVLINALIEKLPTKELRCEMNNLQGEIFESIFEIRKEYFKLGMEFDEVREAVDKKRGM
ncbi:hypothetical protein [uncultured Cetobacterium sp.]|uniref:hypothetical protein n=1 Tax=uncultured Cetobacterium sp. TaxID=527638 RepID=UPI002631287C|nr:hypothetical protein [uncultured Cetobacterium sp.]